jgi:hypothetical protein
LVVRSAEDHDRAESRARRRRERVVIVETCVPDEVRGRRETPKPAANDMRLHLFPRLHSGFGRFSSWDRLKSAMSLELGE